MPSVLHICTDFWPSTGGIEQFVVELASRSVAAGLPATVLCLNRTSSHRSPLPARDSVRGVPVHRVDFIDLKFYKPSLLPLGLLREFDILHVHGPGALLDWVAMSKPFHRRPIVLSTHGGIFHTQALRTFKQAYFFGLQPLIMRAVDVVAACSRQDEELFKRVAPRVVLLENAIDTERYLSLSLDAKHSGLCLFAGRLSPNKGVPSLLSAFARAAALQPHAHLRLVGRDVDGCRARVERQALQLELDDRVTFVGEVSDDSLVREFEAAQVFVSASRYEGFGLSAIEAKAAGCYLVLHANTSFRQLFASDEQAILTDFDVPSSAADALVYALDRYDYTALQSSRHEVEVYSWPRKLGNWFALYRQLAQSGHNFKSQAS